MNFTEKNGTRDTSIDGNLDKYLAEYGASAREERLSGEARARILASLCEQRTEKNASPHTASPSARTAVPASSAVSTQRYRRPVKWAIAAASITVLVLAGAAAVAPSFSLSDNFDSGNSTPEMPAVQNSADQQGNFFALKAWADEAPDGAIAPAAGEPVGINWLHPG